MSADAMVISAVGIIQLTVNVVTMMMTLPRRFSLRFSIGVFSLFTLLLLTTVAFIGAIISPLISIIGLLYFPIIIWLFSGRVLQKLFAFLLQFLFTTSLVTVATALVMLMTGEGKGAATLVWLMANSPDDNAMAIAIIMTLVLFAVYFILILKYGRRFFQSLFTHGRTNEWMLYAAGAIFSSAVMIVLRNLQISPLHHILVQLFILWSFIVLCFAIINTHEKSKQAYEAEFARDIISSGRGHYEKMNEIYDTLRVLRHDYKYHLDTIGELLNSGNGSDAEKYLSDIKKKLSEKELPNYCSNPVINALLSGYAERCVRLDIKLLVEISLPMETAIPNYEMCIILGNLLENAVTASMQYSGSPEIKLKINTQGTHLAIMVKNNYSGEIRESFGLPLSTKKDGGLGLRSVQAVVARYGGELMTEWDDTVFAAYALMKV